MENTAVVFEIKREVSSEEMKSKLLKNNVVIMCVAILVFSNSYCLQGFRLSATL